MVQRNCDQTKFYSHGDPLQYLDWRAFARTDTLLIRQDIQSARVGAKIIIDARSSMLWPESISQLGPMKFSIACRIALHLAARHVQGGQKVFLTFLLQNGSSAEVEILSLAYAVELYERLQPNFALTEWTHFFGPTGPKPQLVYLISDLLGDTSLFSSLSNRGFILHLLHTREWDVTWMQGSTCYYEETEKKEWKGNEIIKHQSHIHKWVETKKQEYDTHPYQYGFFTDQSSLATYMAFIRM